jgi:hypothetical protein
MSSDPDTLLDHIDYHLNLPPDAQISDPELHHPPDYEAAARITISHPSRPHRILLDFLKLPNQPWLLDLLDTA